MTPENYAIQRVQGNANVIYDIILRNGRYPGVFVTGDMVKVDGDLVDTIMYANSIQRIEAPQRPHGVLQSPITRIKSVTMSMSFCGFSKGPSPAALQA